jgi:type I restriction enzyme S subunit
MSRIEQLIRELCPDGVQFTKLADLVDITTGSKPTQELLAGGGKFAYMNGGTKPSGYSNVANTKAGAITIPARGSVGVVSYQSDDFWCGPLCYRIASKDESSLLTHFAYFYLKSRELEIVALQQTGSIPALNKGQLEKFRIAIPPLPVQQEIVHILKAFEKLEASLEAELEARNKQYDFYRGQLLASPEVGGQRVSLGSVTEVVRGEHMTKETAIPGPYPVVSASREALVWHSESNQAGGAVTVSSHGAYAGFINYWPNDFWLGNNVYLLKTNSELLPKFLYFVLKNFRAEISGLAKLGGVPYINASQLADVEIPLPSLEVQNKVVEMLSKLEELTSGMQHGLPAEIAARRKQYEYYLGKLLNFKEMAA